MSKLVSAKLSGDAPVQSKRRVDVIPWHFSLLSHMGSKKPWMPLSSLSTISRAYVTANLGMWKEGVVAGINLERRCQNHTIVVYNKKPASFMVAVVSISNTSRPSLCSLNRYTPTMSSSAVSQEEVAIPPAYGHGAQLSRLSNQCVLRQ